MSLSTNKAALKNPKISQLPLRLNLTLMFLFHCVICKWVVDLHAKILINVKLVKYVLVQIQKIIMN